MTCIEIKRINVSAAFYLSIEFQETGFFAYRMFKSAYGDATSPHVSIPVPIIRLHEFIADAQRVGFGVQVGIGDWEMDLDRSVLRKVADDADLRQQETNRAFVLMQYYGYLRRNPDDLPDSDFRGWEFWLNKLNQFNGNFVQAEMVKAFISSIEYRQGSAPKQGSSVLTSCFLTKF